MECCYPAQCGQYAVPPVYMPTSPNCCTMCYHEPPMCQPRLPAHSTVIYCCEKAPAPPRPQREPESHPPPPRYPQDDCCNPPPRYPQEDCCNPPPRYPQDACCHPPPRCHEYDCCHHAQDSLQSSQESRTLKHHGNSHSDHCEPHEINCCQPDPKRCCAPDPQRCEPECPTHTEEPYYYWVARPQDCCTPRTKQVAPKPVAAKPVAPKPVAPKSNDPTCKPIKTKYIVPCYRYEDGRIVNKLPVSAFKRNGMQDQEYSKLLGTANFFRRRERDVAIECNVCQTDLKLFDLVKEQPSELIRRACEAACGTRQRKPFMESTYATDVDSEIRKYHSEDDQGNFCFHFEKKKQWKPCESYPTVPYPPTPCSPPPCPPPSCPPPPCQPSTSCEPCLPYEPRPPRELAKLCEPPCEKTPKCQYTEGLYA